MITASKLEQRLKSMSAIAQKVYQAVPISEPWAVSFILSEMSRLGFSVKGHRLVSGCLNGLIEAKLICEPSPGLFVRVPIKSEPVIVITPPQSKAPMPAAKPTTEQREPMAVLSGLAERANTFAAGLRQLASDIESAALEIDEYVEAKSADSAKLKQLQQLLGVG